VTAYECPRSPPNAPLPQIHWRDVPPELIAALKAHFGTRCSNALALHEQHGRDETVFDLPPPAAVVFTASTANVAAAVGLAAQYPVPVLRFGVGSSLKGYLLAVQVGVSIDLGRMNQSV
jgi:D-lactate dehydrogenase (cytochrome)